MIKGLFETHINVNSLERSMKFYGEVLNLELGRYEEERRVAFYWLGKWGEAMLGIWEKPTTQVLPQHFAFRCEVDDVLTLSVKYLKERGLRVHNFFNDGTERPMVFAWMPAISIYFNDPDDHSLEFIAMLPGKPRPELGIITYEEWEANADGGNGKK
jgi:predicted enzyme related to lactoylglutathione lyase